MVIERHSTARRWKIGGSALRTHVPGPHDSSGEDCADSLELAPGGDALVAREKEEAAGFEGQATDIETRHAK